MRQIERKGEKKKKYLRYGNWHVGISIKEERTVGLHTKRCLALLREGTCAGSCDKMGRKRSV